MSNKLVIIFVSGTTLSSCVRKSVARLLLWHQAAAAGPTNSAEKMTKMKTRAHPEGEGGTHLAAQTQPSIRAPEDSSADVKRHRKSRKKQTAPSERTARFLSQLANMLFFWELFSTQPLLASRYKIPDEITKFMFNLWIERNSFQTERVTVVERRTCQNVKFS